MTKETVKQGFDAAEKALKEKEIEQVKMITLKTLEKIDTLSKEKDDLKKKERDIDDKNKILKLDVDDLKEGKLEKIIERQNVDPLAKKVSVVLIIKEKEVIREVPYWYWPYQVVWQEPIYTNELKPFNDNTIYFQNTDNFPATCTNYTTINCSTAKNYTEGTYNVFGHIVHLK